MRISDWSSDVCSSDRRPLPRQPDPEPRPARKLLGSGRLCQRRAAVQGLPRPLCAGRQAPAPLDPRRLAAAAEAVALGAARWRPVGGQSAVVAVARQAARQPAPQSGAGGDDRAVRARLAAGAARAGMDAVGTVDAAGGATDRGADGTARQAARTALARAPARSEEHTSELQSLMRISYAVF